MQLSKIGLVLARKWKRMNQMFTPPFWQKCPFSSAKKWHFERQNLRTDSKNLRKHSLKWWGQHLVQSFLFSGEYQANFWKLHLWVYKFETFFGALLTTLKLPCDRRKKIPFFFGPSYCPPHIVHIHPIHHFLCPWMIFLTVKFTVQTNDTIWETNRQNITIPKQPLILFLLLEVLECSSLLHFCRCDFLLHCNSISIGNMLPSSRSELTKRLE